ncbi:doublesex- and mab-3-related transcription factor B1-like [Palaemon carinicauda]|uniref:doublesex- and mab-3-related transcription factor B1-like n=1 Tax=Palaemon carinicauda TaxID=392227 RepID=UPI0035B57A95
MLSPTPWLQGGRVRRDHQFGDPRHCPCRYHGDLHHCVIRQQPPAQGKATGVEASEMLCSSEVADYVCPGAARPGPSRRRPGPQAPARVASRSLVHEPQGKELSHQAQPPSSPEQSCEPDQVPGAPSPPVSTTPRRRALPERRPCLRRPARAARLSPASRPMAAVFTGGFAPLLFGTSLTSAADGSGIPAPGSIRFQPPEPAGPRLPPPSLHPSTASPWHRSGGSRGSCSSRSPSWATASPGPAPTRVPGLPPHRLGQGPLVALSRVIFILPPGPVLIMSVGPTCQPPVATRGNSGLAYRKFGQSDVP